MMRRRRRARSSWAWADRLLLNVNNTSPQFGTPNYYSFRNLLPPGRVKFLCDTGRRDSVTVTGVHMWLDFHWANTSSVQYTIPDVYMYVMKTKEDEGADEALAFDPFVEPQVPANITTWEVAPSDGLDAFLWCHYIRGSTPPNAVVTKRSDDWDGSLIGAAVDNQSSRIFGVPTDGYQPQICRTFRVAAEWQPDVRIKTRRRLEGNEGLMIGMFTTSQPGAGLECLLEVRHRVLVRR